MSQKLKRKELGYREFIPDLAKFSPPAIECLKFHISKQVHFFIKESILIADQRNISNFEPQVTPDHVTEAVNSYKLRHPAKGYNIPMIAADAAILLASLFMNIIFGFQLFEKYETTAAILLTISIGVIAFAIFCKANFDPNYKKAQ